MDHTIATVSPKYYQPKSCKKKSKINNLIFEYFDMINKEEKQVGVALLVANPP